MKKKIFIALIALWLSICVNATLDYTLDSTTTTYVTTTTMPDVYIERNMASTVMQDTQFTVVLNINVDESKSITALGIHEIVPSGWAVSSISNNGQFTRSANKIEWVFSIYREGVKDQSLSYILTVPAGLSLGTVSSFSGFAEYYEGGLQNSSNITGVTSLTVVAGKSTAIRNIPPNLNPGQAFTVTIPTNMSSDVVRAGIVEMIPAGWTVSSISTGGIAQTNPDRIEWIITGSNLTESTLSYQLTVPANASGTANFAGNLSVSTSYGDATIPLGGAKSANIAQGCALKGDYPPCNQITISEILNLITNWAQGKATIPEVLKLIAAWAS